MTPPMMACGCVAQGTHKGEPVCVSHMGILPGAYEVAETPDLAGRVAVCVDCRRERESATALAFFTHDPDRDRDTFYCGCRGWN